MQGLWVLYVNGLLLYWLARSWHCRLTQARVDLVRHHAQWARPTPELQASAEELNKWSHLSVAESVGFD